MTELKMNQMGKKGFFIIFHRYFFYFLVIAFAVYWGYNYGVTQEYFDIPERASFLYDALYIENKDTELIENHIFQMTNNVRNRSGKRDLLRDPDLDIVAKYHSENMVKYNFLGHIDHEGLQPWERASKLGVFPPPLAENIGETPWHNDVIGCGDTTYNFEIAECTVEGWETSQGHLQNIIGNYRYIGIGVHFDDSTSTLYATQVFR